MHALQADFGSGATAFSRICVRTGGKCKFEEFFRDPFAAAVGRKTAIPANPDVTTVTPLAPDKELRSGCFSACKQAHRAF
jgi:hypothetical protein